MTQTTTTGPPARPAGPRTRLRATLSLDGIKRVDLAVPVRADFWDLARALAHWAAHVFAEERREQPGERWCLNVIRAEFALYGTERIALWEEYCPAGERREVAEWAYRAAHRLWGETFGVPAERIDAALPGDDDGDEEED